MINNIIIVIINKYQLQKIKNIKHVMQMKH